MFFCHSEAFLFFRHSRTFLFCHSRAWPENPRRMEWWIFVSSTNMTHTHTVILGLDPRIYVILYGSSDQVRRWRNQGKVILGLDPRIHAVWNGGYSCQARIWRVFLDLRIKSEDDMTPSFWGNIVTEESLDPSLRSGWRLLLLMLKMYKEQGERITFFQKSFLTVYSMKCIIYGRYDKKRIFRAIVFNFRIQSRLCAWKSCFK